MLGAFFSQLSFPYNILGDDTLVLAVYNTFRAAVPALPAIQAFIPLLRRRACDCRVVSGYTGCIRPPGWWGLLVIHMIG